MGANSHRVNNVRCTGGAKVQVAQESPRVVNSHMATISRPEALRKRLGLTQAQVADRAGLRRDEVTKVETGANKATSARVRDGLARAFGVSVDDLVRYLDGALELDALGLPAPGAAPAEGPRVERPGGALDAVLWDAADRSRHTLADVDAVRSVLSSEVSLSTRTDVDLSVAAGRWLDAAATLRRRGQRVTAAALLVQLTAATPAEAERSRERSDRANSEGDQKARELGAEPGAAAGALEKLRKNRS